MPTLPAATRDKQAELSPGQIDALTHLLPILAGAGAVGAGARAVQGLGEMTAQSVREPKSVSRPLVVDVPYKIKRPIKKATPDGAMGKFAADGDTTNSASDVLNRWTKWWLGGQAENRHAVPWYPISAIGGAAGAAYGGYRGLDAILRKKKLQDLEDDIEEAQDEYRQHTLGQFKPLDISKTASAYQDALKGATDTKLTAAAAALSEAFSNISKSATEGRRWWEWGLPHNLVGGDQSWGELAGIYGLGAGALAAGTGAVGYNYARQVNPEREKAKAIKKQIESQALAQPASVYARLVPVDEAGNKLTPRQAEKLKAQYAAEGKQEAVKTAANPPPVFGEPRRERGHSGITGGFGPPSLSDPFLSRRTEYSGYKPRLNPQIGVIGAMPPPVSSYGMRLNAPFLEAGYRPISSANRVGDITDSDRALETADALNKTMVQPMYSGIKNMAGTFGGVGRGMVEQDTIDKAGPILSPLLRGFARARNYTGLGNVGTAALLGGGALGVGALGGYGLSRLVGSKKKKRTDEEDDEKEGSYRIDYPRIANATPTLQFAPLGKPGVSPTNANGSISKAAEILETGDNGDGATLATGAQEDLARKAMLFVDKLLGKT